jgi:crotonobetainyl-CoA:carnitine CoA-transferase CaiB-like acyl-CoA transferase
VQSECGITAQNGNWKGKPHRVGFSVLDYLSGRDLVIGVLAALRRRDTTSEGSLVDCCLYNSGVSVLEDAIPGYDMEGVIPAPMGSRHPSACPHGLYQTSDGYVNIIAIDNKLWSRLCSMMDNPELQNREGFRSAQERIRNREQVDATIEAWTRQHTTAQVLERMEEHDLPHGHLCDVRAVIESEQTRYWDMAPVVEQPMLGHVRINGCPVKLSGTSTGVRGPAPLLGEHNQEVLRDLLGFSDSEYHIMCKEHVLEAETAPPWMLGTQRRTA